MGSVAIARGRPSDAAASAQGRMSLCLRCCSHSSPRRRASTLPVLEFPRARARRQRRVPGLPDAPLPRRRGNTVQIYLDARARPRRAPLGRRGGREHRLHGARRRRASPPRSWDGDGARVAPRRTRTHRRVLARRRRAAHRHRLVPARLDARRARPPVRGRQKTPFSAEAPSRCREIGSAARRPGAARAGRARAPLALLHAHQYERAARADCARPSRHGARPRGCASSSRRSMARDTMMLELRVDPRRVTVGVRGRLGVAARAIGAPRPLHRPHHDDGHARSRRSRARRSSPRVSRLPRATRRCRAGRRAARRRCARAALERQVRGVELLVVAREADGRPADVRDVLRARHAHERADDAPDLAPEMSEFAIASALRKLSPAGAA